MRRHAIGLAMLMLLAPSCASLAQEPPRTSPLPDHMPLGKEACYGRVYDAAHLKKHPKQRVTAFHLFRDFTPDPNTETPLENHQALIDSDGEGGIRITAYVRFRDRPGLFFNGMACASASEGGKVRCGIECDGGGFFVKGDGKSLLLENQGFVVIGGCGANEDEAEQAEFVTLEEADEESADSGAVAIEGEDDEEIEAGDDEDDTFLAEEEDEEEDDVSGIIGDVDEEEG